MASNDSGSAPSLLFYCHEGLGLGHLRRILTLGQHFATEWPGVNQLIVTSTAAAGVVVPSESIDYVKLPAVRRVRPEEDEAPFEARSLRVPFQQLWSMRRDLLLSVVRNYQPDALIVDYMPAGLKGDLVPALRYLKANAGTRFVLGLRDILDEGQRVRRAWRQDGVYELLEEIYDLILVFGQPDVYDLVAETGLPPRIAARVRYVGYLRRGPGGRSPEQVRASLGLQTGRLVLATIGGGTDGHELLACLVEALRLRPAARRFDTLLVAGPLMAAADRRRLRERLPPGAPVHFLDYVDDLSSYIAAADAVIARAGYNTISEILSFGRPAIVVPRVVKLAGRDDIREQLIRAEALRQRGLARVIDPEELSPERLLAAIEALLDEPPRPASGLSFDGLPGAASELRALLAAPRG